MKIHYIIISLICEIYNLECFYGNKLYNNNIQCMSKFNIKNNINNINKIVYDYYNITVYPGDIKYSEDDKYVKISTPFPLNVPNITYPDNLQNYK